jgi:hypothetical protein
MDGRINNVLDETLKLALQANVHQSVSYSQTHSADNCRIYLLVKANGVPCQLSRQGLQGAALFGLQGSGGNDGHSFDAVMLIHHVGKGGRKQRYDGVAAPLKDHAQHISKVTWDAPA